MAIGVPDSPMQQMMVRFKDQVRPGGSIAAQGCCVFVVLFVGGPGAASLALYISLSAVRVFMLAGVCCVALWAVRCCAVCCFACGVCVCT